MPFDTIGSIADNSFHSSLSIAPQSASFDSASVMLGIVPPMSVAGGTIRRKAMGIMISR